MGHPLETYREQNGRQSQEELARRVGVTKSAVSLWESGKRAPSAKNLRRLSKITGIHVVDLLGAAPGAAE